MGDELACTVLVLAYQASRRIENKVSTIQRGHAICGAPYTSRRRRDCIAGRPRGLIHACSYTPPAAAEHSAKLLKMAMPSRAETHIQTAARPGLWRRSASGQPWRWRDAGKITGIALPTRCSRCAISQTPHNDRRQAALNCLLRVQEGFLFMLRPPWTRNGTEYPGFASGITNETGAQ